MSTFVSHCWSTMQDMAPWLFLGALIAGVLHVFLPAGFVRRHLGRGGFRDVLNAALFGVPLPLCSCGVIPATLGIRKDGASEGAAVSFLISTPQTGVDSILVSATFLGWPFALFKVVSAFVTGLLGGVVVNLTTPRKAAPPPAVTAATAEAGRARLSLRWALVGILHFAVVELLGGIWRWLALGILVSAAISTGVPANAWAGQPWATGMSGLLLVLAISLPMYVCATGSVPIAAALVASGLEPGAALVFLMAGPATNAATVGAVLKTFGRRVLLVYLGVIALASLGLGRLFGFLVVTAGAPPVQCTHHAGVGVASVAAAALGLLLLGFAGTDLRRWYRRRRTAEAGRPAVRLRVTGMSCNGCANRVRGLLGTQSGVRRVQVARESGLVELWGEGLDAAALAVAVRRLGFGAEPLAG
jgi:uncharacterized membrane protein YraQ (UPF0718 family)/copper chaperone CopZ